MAYLVGALDLVAGLLVGIHLWVPEQTRETWDKRLLKLLIPEKHQLDGNTIKWSVLIGLFVILGIMIYGYFVDIKAGNFTSEQLLTNFAFVVGGVLIAALVFIGLIAIYANISFFRKIPLATFLPITSIPISIATLFLLNVTGISIDSVIIGFVASLAFMALSFQSIPLIRKFLTLEKGVLARIGITIFVIGKIIYLFTV